MFATITNVQKESCELQKSIDNCCGKRLVGLRSITFTVGWQNVEKSEGFGYEKDGRTVGVKLPPGLWNFKQIKDFVTSELDGKVNITVSKANGLATMTIGPDSRVMISPVLGIRLGFRETYSANKGLFVPGEYVSDNPVDFAFTKTLGVYLNRVNTSYNMLDGAPSTLLKTVQASDCFFGETVTLDFPHPEMKVLESGHIHEFTVSILDDQGRKLNNYYPISVVLEISN